MRVAWVARAPNPYRYPVWRAFAQVHELRLSFLQETPEDRDWRLDEGCDEDSRPLVQTIFKAVGPRYKEDRLWLLLPGWRAQLRGVESLVLQGAWETPAFWQILVWARLRRIPCVYLFESSLESSRYTRGPVSWLRRLFFRSVDRVVALGPAAADYAREILSGQTRKLSMSHNPVDVDFWHRQAAHYRGLISDRPAGHVFVVVAKLVGRKNVDKTMIAFDEIAQSGDELIVCGTGPLQYDLLQLRKRLSKSGAIRFPGHLDADSLAAVYARGHTLVLASSEEVWGLVVNEALAAGLHAVISVRAGVYQFTAAMRGVFGCDPTVRSISEAMAQSRTAWRGWIDEPEMLQFTPDSLSNDIERVVRAIVPRG